MIGTLYSTNITPDPETGIGKWSDDEFVRALHEGVGRGGETSLSRVSLYLLRTHDPQRRPCDQGLSLQS